MMKAREYLVRWIKFDKEREDGDSEVLELGSAMCSSYDRAIQFEDFIRDFIQLREFNKNDFIEVVKAEDNIEISYIDYE